jgi:hypothetical protein
LESNTHFVEPVAASMAAAWDSDVSGVNSLAVVGPTFELPSLMVWSGDFQRQTTRKSFAFVRSICERGE